MGRSRSARIGLFAFLLVVVVDVIYLAEVTLVGVDPESSSPVNAIFRILILWMPVIVCWVAAVTATSHRLPIFLAATGTTAWAIGGALYNVQMGASGYVPSPAPSDIAYLSFYAFLVAAFVALAARGSRRSIVPVALEAVIAGLGTASALMVIVQPVLDAAASQTVPARPLTLVYPLLDVALVAITAGAASNPALAGTRRVWWFLAGISLFVATDLAYALQAIAGDYRAGALTDAGWPIGFALLAWWALGFVAPPKKRTASRSVAVLRLVAPGVAVVAAIGVLVYASQRQVSVIAVVLATITVALTAIPVVTRQTLSRRLIAGQQRVLSELRELDASKSEMMATLNHEMRTPLTSILGYLEVVRDGAGGDLPAEADEMLAAVEHSANRLHAIVDEMLVLTRLEAHALDVQMEPLDVSTVVQRVVGQLAPIADGRQVAFRLELVGTAPLVLGDGSRLGHALTTVAENAVKFTPNGGSVTVSVTVRKHVRPVVITVSDTGMGIPAEDLPHLFERFYRGSNALKSSVGGSGLGLAIAQGIVELHGGRIRASSVLGEGTSMVITLPAAS